MNIAVRDRSHPTSTSNTLPRVQRLSEVPQSTSDIVASRQLRFLHSAINCIHILQSTSQPLLPSAAFSKRWLADSLRSSKNHQRNGRRKSSGISSGRLAAIIVSLVKCSFGGKFKMEALTDWSRFHFYSLSTWLLLCSVQQYTCNNSNPSRFLQFGFVFLLFGQRNWTRTVDDDDETPLTRRFARWPLYVERGMATTWLKGHPLDGMRQRKSYGAVGRSVVVVRNSDWSNKNWL